MLVAIRSKLTCLIVGILCVALASPLIPPVFAGPVQDAPFAFQSPDLWYWSQKLCVEQQSPGCLVTDPQALTAVKNPFHYALVGKAQACVWDIDDIVNLMGTGVLQPGEVREVRLCLLADWGPGHLVGLRGIAESRRPAHKWGTAADLTMEVDFFLWTPGFRLGTVTDAWPHVACVVGPKYEQTNSALKVIPDSHNGTAARGAIVFRVQNVGTKPVVARVEAAVTPQYGNFFDVWCPSGWPGWITAKVTEGTDPAYFYDGRRL